MGQSLSRRPVPQPAPASAPPPRHVDNTHTPHRSLPRRILSSIPNPSLRSRSLSSSRTLPTRPEQTLRGKNRRWWPSRRHGLQPDAERAVPERMHPITEHDEHQVDRDVDEFGVITHRVPDNHSNSPAPSAKGKEKAKDVPDADDDDQDDDQPPVPSSSSTSPFAQRPDHSDNDQVDIAPTVPPSSPGQPPPPPFPTLQDSERISVPLSPLSASPPQVSHQQPNTNPRPFPPPGTLVVVQGVVHTTDVLRASDRPVATSNPTPPTNGASHSSTNTSPETSSARPSSVPPATRSRNPLSGVFPRPNSMVPAVPSSPPSEPPVGSSNIDSQDRRGSNASGIVEDGEDEDRTTAHPHGISMAQGPVGASGLSASSIDVLGTLLSVAAAATAASLLTGSSEPIFSSGLTSSHPNSAPQPTGLSPSIPSERPLSPTPTSDAGRMRHVWSSLRDRLGLGSGAHGSSHPNYTPSNSGTGQNMISQPLDTRPRDPREIMLAEMARAFNLGLGLSGATTNAPSVSGSPNANAPDFAMPEDVPAGGGDGERTSLPPPDSFERFLMDLQSDLRDTLMQEQEPDASAGVPQEAGEPIDDVEDNQSLHQSLPELQSVSDSDSEEFEMRHSDIDDEDEDDSEDMDDGFNEEDAHTAEEQLSGRTSPAVSAFATGIRSPFGVRDTTSSSLRDGGMSAPLTAPSQSISTAISSRTEGDFRANKPSTDNRVSGDADQAAHTPSSGAVRIGARTHVPADYSMPSGVGGQAEGATQGVAHSLPQVPNGWGSLEAEGRAVSGVIAVPPHVIQDPSMTAQESLLPGVSSSFGPLTSNTSNSLSGGTSTTEPFTQPSSSTLPFSSNSEPTVQSPSSTNPPPGDPSTMPFRLPFAPSSASRTEHTPGGGINWWRMYRFPAIAPPSLGQPGASSASSPLSQSPFRVPTQDPSHSSTSPWAHSTDQSQQNETIASRGMAEVPGVHSGLAAPALTPSNAAPLTNTPELVSPSNQSPPSTNAQDFNPTTSTSTNPAEYRSNVVVPVIVVGLQSVNMDRQPPHMPHPPVNHIPANDDEDGEAMGFDGLEHPMSMPMHIPEPVEFRHHPSPFNTAPQEHNQQPARGRTWQSRAANAIRNLRPSRRNTDATGTQPQEPPGSRTFLIYVIGGYYPPDHQIITGGNLDSFEALWELAELLGQAKPPTVSKEDIEKSGLEIIKACMLQEYEKQGRVASNCIDRCLICLDDYDPEDELRVLTCKHTFHQGCVDRWLETGRNNCPACRTKGVVDDSPGPASATA